MTSQQKIDRLGKLIPKTVAFTSNGKYQLLARMPQSPHMLGGLMLILIFATHFVQARFNQAQLPYGLNSCIILYFILLSMTQAHVTCGLEGMGWFILDLLHEPNPCVLPSGQGTLVASQAYRGGLVSKISTLKQLLCFG